MVSKLLLVGFAFMSTLPISGQSLPSLQDWSARALWDSWPELRFVNVAAPCLTPALLNEELDRLRKGNAGKPGDADLSVEQIGTSALGRPIHLLTVGSGPRKVLLWSQMHGDEPSATPALLDLAHLLSQSQTPEAVAIRENLTLLMVPMLNPDGAARYTRRNAYGIDLNRDALHLATPEARLLKQIRDEHEPILGINLHDQGRRILAGDTGRLATISLLGVAGDEAGTLTPGRERAMRAAAAVIAAVSPQIHDGIGRYDEDWNPRAFGDNVTRWGTPVLLIESGGIPAGMPMTDLTRLNFTGIAFALAGLAMDDLKEYDIETYRSLPRNKRDGFSDVVITGAQLLHPTTDTAYRADLAIDVRRTDFDLAECQERISPRLGSMSSIVEVGDGSLRIGGETVDAQGWLLIPALEVAATGLDAKAWLTSETLLELARLGVASVTWEVEPQDWKAAREHALTVNATSRSKLVPSLDSSRHPHISAAPVSQRREEVLTWGRLLSSLRASLVPGETMRSGKEVLRELRPFRRGQNGSFIAFDSMSFAAETSNPTADTGVLAEDAEVREVWIDGSRVSARTP